MSSIRILGLMSGSSLDGLDLAICQFDERSEGKITYEIIYSETVPYPKEIHDVLSKSPNGFKDIVRLDFALCQFWAKCINGIDDSQEVHFISSHGHTIWHSPDESISVQLGNGGTLSALTRLPVVCDFRMQDVALKGQGTPLVPILEKELFKEYIVFLNLGGIANLTSTERTVQAIDVTPCNQLLNFLSDQKGFSYDDGGKMAATGNMDHELYDSMMALPYFSQSSNKSLDNLWIQENCFPLLRKGTPNNGLFTLCHFIADRVKDQLSNWGISGQKIFTTGGGAYNDFLIDCINLKIGVSQNEIFIPTKDMIEYKESLLMAFLGYLRIQKKPNVLSSVTTSSMDTVGGAIYDVYGTLGHE